MDSNKNSKNLIILGIVLLVLAGCIVVALKGFNVSLLFGKHEAVELRLGVEYNTEEIDSICKEIFTDEKYVLKGVEVFNDAFQLNVSTITDEQKENLINKVNEKYSITKTVEDLKVYSVPNKRIRDVALVYLKPVVVIFFVVFVYMLIRFKKSNSIKLIKDTMLELIVTQLVLYSIIAIARVPFEDVIVNLSMFVAIIELIVILAKAEVKIEKENVY